MAGAVDSLAWSNPLAWWSGVLTLIGGANIAVWFVLYYRLHDYQLDAGSADRLGNAFGTEPMLLLCAAYVFGCAFRSFLPRADVQRICLFDTWLSSVVVGRSVATLAELLRRAVGHFPAAAWRHDGSGHDAERGLARGAADCHRAMLLMVRRC